MLATAIIGRIVGVKYASRRKPRPAILPLTHTAISSASAIDAGIVPSAYQRLFVQRLPEDRVVGELPVIVEADETRRPCALRASSRSCARAVATAG